MIINIFTYSAHIAADLPKGFLSRNVVAEGTFDCLAVVKKSSTNTLKLARRSKLREPISNMFRKSTKDEAHNTDDYSELGWRFMYQVRAHYAEMICVYGYTLILQSLRHCENEQ